MEDSSFGFAGPNYLARGKGSNEDSANEWLVAIAVSMSAMASMFFSFSFLLSHFFFDILIAGTDTWCLVGYDTSFIGGTQALVSFKV